MNNNSTINWQYATNFTENEKRFAEVKELMIAKMRTITKSSLLSMTIGEEAHEAYKMVKAIEEGDRSEFLYEKAKEAVDSAANLEEAGELFTRAFAKALSKKIDNEH